RPAVSASATSRVSPASVAAVTRSSVATGSTPAGGASTAASPGASSPQARRADERASARKTGRRMGERVVGKGRSEGGGSGRARRGFHRTGLAGEEVGEVVAEGPVEPVQREADDVVVVPLDAGDEEGAVVVLDPVGARLVERRPGGDVAGDLGVGEGGERDGGGLVGGDAAAGSGMDEGEAGVDGVR